MLSDGYSDSEDGVIVEKSSSGCQPCSNMANDDIDSEEETLDEGSEVQNKQKENDDIEKGNDEDWSTGFSVRFEFFYFIIIACKNTVCL